MIITQEAIGGNGNSELVLPNCIQFQVRMFICIHARKLYKLYKLSLHTINTLIIVYFHFY